MKQKTYVLKRSHLESLSKDELIDIILTQAERITQQEDTINELKKQINKLISKVEELDRASKRQAAPFRREEKELKKKKKKPGRKKGHKGHYRKFTGTPDQVIEKKLESCPQCGHHKFNDVEKIEQYVQDIVAKVITTKLVTYKGQCSHCYKECETDHPLKISNATGAAGTYIGSRARSLAMELNFQFGLSKRNSVNVLKKIFGLKLSPGGLTHMGHKAAEVLDGDYENLKGSIRNADYVHADETSWYVGNPKYWLWTFTNKAHTLYHVIDSRARQVIYDILGKDYKGVLISDCLSIYDDVNKVQQKCYSHHLKALKLAEESASGHAEDIHLIKALKSLLSTAILIKKLQKDAGEQRYRTGIKNLVKQSDRLIPSLNMIEQQLEKGQYDHYLESTVKVLKRLSRQKDHLFTFLHYDYVDATNNLAERQLRPAVISRKISCGNRSIKGAKTWQVMTSMIQTCKQQEVLFAEKLTGAYYRYLKQPVPT